MGGQRSGAGVAAAHSASGHCAGAHADRRNGAGLADLLRNTPAVCRRCDIHPAVLDAFEAGMLAALEMRRTPRGLRVDEAAFAALLKQAARRDGRCTSR